MDRVVGIRAQLTTLRSLISKKLMVNHRYRQIVFCFISTDRVANLSIHKTVGIKNESITNIVNKVAIKAPFMIVA
ncbi:protein of unknown function [Pseudodesulfovibrio piezophilus C1TLV30]|uniref:Uncharacterized protein n=1 Tax=Pseudodesulfovibrio piezophilus (strain DSM 21447 / JCM 15486 / C1TLV30) TaxID=1322246 RepID=M1WJG6_PSEP2|nr:protein of unknown function [Pseudodesulfovibrio piezophilus C1TLV30]